MELLRSNIHRVVSPAGAQAEHTRYSLVYFARPQDNFVLKRLESGKISQREISEENEDEQITSRDWILRRALSHRVALNNDTAYEWDKNQGTEKQSQRTYLWNRSRDLPSRRVPFVSVSRHSSCMRNLWSLFLVLPFLVQLAEGWSSLSAPARGS
jgi:hypothetical protein